MGNLEVGLLCMMLSVFLFFLSPREPKNMFGYKSPQQGINQQVWKCSNRFFGLFAMIGSCVYLAVTVLLMAAGITKYDALVNQIGMIYVFLCIIATEVYTFKKTKKEE